MLVRSVIIAAVVHRCLGGHGPSSPSGPCMWQQNFPPAPPVSPIAACDSCIHASDGECDDGGPGSAYSLCDTGTDCTDCGVESGSGDSGTSGRQLQDQELYTSRFRHLQTGNDGWCYVINTYTGRCGLFGTDSTCWDEAIILGQSRQVCCAINGDECCEANIGVIVGFSAGMFIVLAFITAASCYCCFKNDQCACCPCNKNNPSRRASLSSVPEGGRPSVATPVQAVPVATPVEATAVQAVQGVQIPLRV
uniref:Uncharacterized protein n=1 Tax=Prymnesium polylepis TaxID=72548 RepID=A0A7S4M2N9_9EUKA